MSKAPVVILCGGKGSRMKENGEPRPKPMVDVGGRPILWHIMQLYAAHEFKNFILPLGYKGNVIRSYFEKKKGEFKKLGWTVTMLNTGVSNLKGSRIKQVAKYIKDDHFHLTYGDGVSSVDLKKLFRSHVKSKKMGTVTVVRPPSRFGELIITAGRVKGFEEKPQMSTGAINGGFFVFRREFLSYLSTRPSCDLEFGALQKIAKKGQLQAFRHNGFWQCMDTPRERNFLNKLWSNGAPWRKW